MGILMKVLFVAVVTITIMAFVWEEATSILPIKVVIYVKVLGVLLSVVLASMLFLF